MQKNAIFAAIDIGANAIRMEIVQYKGDRKITTLETLNQPVRLGIDTFFSSTITRESAHAALKIFNNFRKKLREYGTVTTRIVATSALQDAQNRAAFVDFIQQNCGFTIEVLEEQDVCQLLVQAILANVGSLIPDPAANLLVVDLGSGNDHVAFLKNQNLVLYRTLKIGALRLKQILKNVEVESIEFYKTLRAFIHNDVDLLKTTMPFQEVDFFITSGSLMTDVFKILYPEEKQASPRLIDINLFNSKFDRFKNSTVEQFVTELNLPLESADILLPTLTVYAYFLKIFQPVNIIFSTASLTEGVILDYFKPVTNITEQVLAAAKSYGEKFNYDRDHAAQVAMLAESIFNETRQLLGLKKQDLLILLVAALLHDIGRYVNDREHHKHSGYLIAASALPNLSRAKLLQASLIARNHRHYSVQYSPKASYQLTDKEKLKIEKLTVILRMANALDRGHSQAVKSVSIKYKKDSKRLVFTLKTKGNVALEKWAFNLAKELFQNLTYIECTLSEQSII